LALKAKKLSKLSQISPKLEFSVKKNTKTLYVSFKTGNISSECVKKFSGN